MSKTQQTLFVNSHFFEGVYKDIWKAIMPFKETQAEVSFLENTGGLKAGDRILDVMCGHGRHAIELARRGYMVTAVDNLENYISEIEDVSIKEDLRISLLQDDVVEMRLDGKYKLAICMGNSLCFFDREAVIQILRNISNHLTKEGIFVLNMWDIAEIAIPRFREKAEGIVGGVKMITESKYLLQPTRIETKTTFIKQDGDVEIKDSVDYVFSFGELEKMLEDTGFRILESYSIPGRKKFQFGDPRLYIVATKN